MRAWRDPDSSEHFLPDYNGPSDSRTMAAIAKSFFTFLAILALLWVALAKVQQAHSAERPPSTGLVKVTQEIQTARGTQVSIGSGACVSPDGWIITAAHVVESQAPVYVIFDQSINSQIAAVSYRDTRSDIAVLKVECEAPLPCVYVADTAPVKGRRVYSEGYPAGNYARWEGSIRVVESRHYGAVGALFNNRPTVQIIEVDYRVQQGNSGGPLFNAAGEVVGVSSSIPVRSEEVTSYFIGTAEIHTALTKCGAKGWKKQTKRASKLLPKAYVIGSKDCGPCNAFKADYGTKKRAGGRPDLTQYLNQHWRVRYVEKKNASKIISKYRLQGTLPVFMAANIPGGVLYGYEGADALMQTLDEVLAKAPLTEETNFEVGPDDGVECDFDGDPFFDSEEFMEGEGDVGGDALAQAEPVPPRSVRRPPTGQSQPRTAPPLGTAPRTRPAPKAVEPTPIVSDDAVEESDSENDKSDESTTTEPKGGHKMKPVNEDEAEELDLSKLTVIVLAKKTVPVAGKLVSLLEERASSSITDKINEALDDKAAIELVFERTDPEKYAAIVEASGVSGEKLGNVLIIAPKSFDGLPGKIVGIVEAKLQSLSHKALSGLPVAAVFERTDADSYAAIEEALAVHRSNNGGSASSGKLDLFNPLTWILSGCGGILGVILLVLRKVLGDNNKLVLAISKLQKPEEK